MNDPRATDRLLTAWFESEAPASPPDALRTDIDRATARIRPRPAWLARLGGHHMDVIVGGGVRQTSRLVPILALLLLVLALVAAVAFVGGPNDNDGDPIVVLPTASPTAPNAASQVASPAPAPSALADATIQLPHNITELVAGDEAMWITVAGAASADLPRSIHSVDPTTTQATVVVADMPTSATSPFSIVETEGSIWAAAEPNRMLRFDSSTGAQTGTIPLGAFPIEPYVAFDAVWSQDYDDGALTRIDPTTGEKVTTIVIEQFHGQGPRDVAAGAELLWAITPRTNVMVGIDPATNTVVKEVALAANLHCGVAVAGGRVWVGGCDSYTAIQVFDEATGNPLGTFGEQPVPGLPIHADGNVVWIPNGASGSTKLEFVDATTLRPTGRPAVDLGVQAGWLVTGHGSLWYTVGPNLYRLSLDALTSS